MCKTLALWYNKKSLTNLLVRDSFVLGGELGIRTPGPVTVNSFQDCRNRPLCQLSGCKIIGMKVNSQIKLLTSFNSYGYAYFYNLKN